MITQWTLLTALPVALLVVGLLAFVAGELLVAGVCFFALSLAIFLREKRV